MCIEEGFLLGLHPDIYELWAWVCLCNVQSCNLQSLMVPYLCIEISCLEALREVAVAAEAWNPFLNAIMAKQVSHVSKTLTGLTKLT